jgi:hypothetical protein
MNIGQVYRVEIKSPDGKLWEYVVLAMFPDDAAYEALRLFNTANPDERVKKDAVARCEELLAVESASPTVIRQWW